MIRRALLLGIAVAWPALAAAQVPPVPPPPPAEDHSQHQMPPAPAEDHTAHQAPPAAVVLPPFIPPVTDADRAAAFPDVHNTMAHDDNALNYFVLFDQLEWQSGDDDALSWDTKGWVGRDRDRLWFRTEGEREGSRLAHAEAQLFYGRAIARWWDALVGLRQDARPGTAQTWVGVGLQGLAPYWFEVEATAYVSTAGRTHVRLKSEYELLVTNRLILQPLVEANLYGKADPSRALGAGLSALEGGLRLRYEFRREFAPYIGVTWQRRLFGAADQARASGERTGNARLAIGLRLWL
ncbi:MAG: copper resistance protein B [Acidobacteria bacterium]|nr:copper resistance protein B [Acidobacteriota bacterium]